MKLENRSWPRENAKNTAQPNRSQSVADPNQPQRREVRREGKVRSPSALQSSNLLSSREDFSDRPGVRPSSGAAAWEVDGGRQIGCAQPCGSDCARGRAHPGRLRLRCSALFASLRFKNASEHPSGNQNHLTADHADYADKKRVEIRGIRAIRCSKSSQLVSGLSDCSAAGRSGSPGRSAICLDLGG